MANQVPALLKVPLDPAMHYDLGQIRAAHARPSTQILILLRGSEFLPIVTGIFSRMLEEKEESLRIHAASHP